MEQRGEKIYFFTAFFPPISLYSISLIPKRVRQLFSLEGLKKKRLFLSSQQLALFSEESWVWLQRRAEINGANSAERQDYTDALFH